MNLSVIMITKNAGDVIEDALISIKGLWTELLVSDENSSDSTVEIVKSFGATIYTSKNTNLGIRKQSLVQRASGDLILILDSDERVSAELKKEIQALLKQKATKYAGFEIPFENYAFGRQVQYGGESYSRVNLFKKGKGKVKKVPVHEHVVVDGAVKKLSGVMKHYSYRSFGEVISTFSEYADKIALEKAKKGEKATPKKLFIYGPRMFWARLIRDQGYKDGAPGLFLAFLFAFMETLIYWNLLPIQKNNEK